MVGSHEQPGAYDAFAQEIFATNIISDPWLEGRARFRLEPVLLDAGLYGRMCAACEAIGRVYDELAAIVWAEPALLDTYFALTPYQKLMWLASNARWHGIARLDLFLLADGSMRVCEMNSDTPSGEAETVLLNRLRHRFHPGVLDPNAEFERSFVEMVMAQRDAAQRDTAQHDAAQHGAAQHGASGPATIGIIYPTDLPEDLSMIALYRTWFTERGHDVVIGSPFNIHAAPDGRLALFDRPIDIAIRHYKTDWWGERIPAWSDEEDYDDPEPIASQLRIALDADASGRTAIVNPFGAVLTQNKLTMAFLWDFMDRFSEDARTTIEALIPETRRLDDLQMSPDRNDWVLKSDYGCESDEVVIGRYVSDAIWAESLAAASPGRWVVQRFFDAAVRDGAIPNFGVYLVAGRAGAVFTRLSPQATDYSSVVAPTYVIPQTEYAA